MQAQGKAEWTRVGYSKAGYARYVGRVGALAVALGVGSALASMPAAFADATDSGGSTAVSSATSDASSPTASNRSSRGAAARGRSASSAHVSSATAGSDATSGLSAAVRGRSETSAAPTRSKAAGDSSPAVSIPAPDDSAPTDGTRGAQLPAPAAPVLPAAAVPARQGRSVARSSASPLPAFSEAANAPAPVGSKLAPPLFAMGPALLEGPPQAGWFGGMGAPIGAAISQVLFRAAALIDTHLPTGTPLRNFMENILLGTRKGLLGTSSLPGEYTLQNSFAVAGGYPYALTPGADGSIWALTGTERWQGGNPAGPVIASLQQIADVNGAWYAQTPIGLLNNPGSLAAGTDGKIWVAYPRSGAVQVISNVDGVWTAQAPIGGFDTPISLQTGPDGTIYVANYGSGTVQQLSSAGTVLNTTRVIGGPATMAYSAIDGSVWVSDVLPGTYGAKPVVEAGLVQQISGGTAQTAFTFDYTVPAITFTGTLQSLTVGTDGTVWVINPYQGPRPIVYQTDVGWTSLSPIFDSISSGLWPGGVAPGLDGSIWLTSAYTPQVQQILKVNGAWVPQTPIGGFKGHPEVLTTATDGSVWVGTTAGWVQQLVVAPGAPRNVSVAGSTSVPGQLSVTWDAAVSGGTPVLGYTVTAQQGTQTWTQTTNSGGRSGTFTVNPSGGAVTVSITATNLVGRGLAAVSSGAGQAAPCPLCSITV